MKCNYCRSKIVMISCFFKLDKFISQQRYRKTSTGVASFPRFPAIIRFGFIRRTTRVNFNFFKSIHFISPASTPAKMSKTSQGPFEHESRGRSLRVHLKTTVFSYNFRDSYRRRFVYRRIFIRNKFLQSLRTIPTPPVGLRGHERADNGVCRPRTNYYSVRSERKKKKEKKKEKRSRRTTLYNVIACARMCTYRYVKYWQWTCHSFGR